MLQDAPAEVPYHSAFLAVSELADLAKEHDAQLLNALHGLFDNLPLIEEERRYREGNQIKIPRPQASLLAGTTPAYLVRAFPASAWDEGFMARSIIIFADQMIEPDLFSDNEQPDPAIALDLVDDLRKIGSLKGRMTFTPDAMDAIRAWQRAKYEPAPKHPKLEHYNTRRIMHALKLSIISSASRSDDMQITAENFQEALGWMLEAEEVMPKLFNDMIGRSDGQVMNEAYHFIRSQWDSTSPALREQPVKKSLLANFLRYKIPHYQIESFIGAMLSADLLTPITKNGTVYYKPNLKAGLYKHGKPN